jgi:integrase
MIMPKPKRPKKAAGGQGSIFKREITRKDGSTYIRWEGNLSFGRDGNGKRKRTVVYGPSQAYVLAKMDAIKRQVATGTFSEDKRTVKEYLEDWLKHKELETKPRTHEFYSFYALERVVPRIGGVKLSKLNASHVRVMMQDLTSKISADCANKSRSILSRAMRQAVKDGLLHRNPVDATEPLKVAPREDIIWSNDEVMLFLTTARTHRLYAAFYLALSTGMRHGEVLGLRWQDIEGDTINIVQTIVKVKGNYHISTPKTDKGNRRVVLDTETIATLEEHRLKQAEEARGLKGEWQADKHLGLVFTTVVGTPIHPRNFDRTWYYLQDAAKKAYVNFGRTEEEKKARARQIEEGKVLPHLRFHDLRHMHVSLLNKAGVDARTIADRIGHTDPAFTLKRYAHVFEDQRKAAAIPLLRLLSPPKGEPT